MAASSRRAVFTGVGVLSSIGLNATAFWQSLRDGKSGVRTIRSFDTSGLPVHIAGEVQDFDPKSYLEKKDRKSLRMMARTIQFAVAGAHNALQDAGVAKDQLDPTRFGVEFGSGLIAMELPEIGDASRISSNCQPGQVDLQKWGGQGIPTVQPLWMLKYLPNMLACHVSILNNAQGPSNTITESDVASLLAIGEAFRILQRDQADFFLTGGAESKINPLSMIRQCLFEPLSRRNDEPEKACRPFCSDRDGLVIGEGGGVLVLEDLDHARRRGARVYAELIGFGAAFDLKKSGSGLARAIRAALAEAGITPADIDHINANGVSSPEGDLWEARGLAEVFGGCDPSVPVIAPKSYFGNLGATAGSVELAASLLGFHHGEVPGSLNFETPDPECPVAVRTGSPAPIRTPYFLKVGMTQLGQCAALVCKRWNE